VGRRPRRVWSLAAALVWAATSAAEPLVFRGASDASAAAALDARHFVVADDEHNTLLVFRLDEPVPVGRFDLNPYLGAVGKHPEADIEGAARVGDRIYWITSHGRNRDGKERPNRYAFFATDVEAGRGDQPPSLVPVGRPYRRLAADLARHPELRFLELEKSIGLGRSLAKQERKALAPKKAGLNIEGLAAGPNGSLFMGLRNPRYAAPSGGYDLAIVLVLRNPDAMVIDGRDAEFAAPLLLDAGGLGIRSLEAVLGPSESIRYVVAAGPAGDAMRFRFFGWSAVQPSPGASPTASPTPPPRELSVSLPPDFAPEAVFQLPGTDTLWLLSDDGSLPRDVAGRADCLPGELLGNGRCPNKYLADRDQRTFRALAVRLEDILK